MSEAIRRVADHDYSIDERMIAHVDVWLPGAHEPLQDWALNDITLERADRGKMVELSVRVDDVEMSSFGCDGVIVSTRPDPPHTRSPREGRSCGRTSRRCSWCRWRRMLCSPAR